MKPKNILSALAIGAVCVLMCACGNMNAKKGYIGRTELKAERFTPEVLLALGRISDPQLSPDGNYILYGVSYNSIEENRSCRNIFIAGADGATIEQLTMDGKNISNARFCDGGGKIIFIQDGQIWCAPLNGSQGHFSLGKRVRLSNVPNGVSEFALSPDESKIMYVSTVKSAVKSPADVYPELDKAEAYSTDDLMYRHWDHWKTELPHTYVSSVDFSADCVVPDSSADILGPEGALFELPIEPFGGLEQLSWSPDSKYIAYSCKKLTGKEYAFSTDTEIYIYNVETGISALIPFGGGYDTDPAWSPDGSQLCWLSMARNGYEADKVRLMVAALDPSALEEATASAEADHILNLFITEITAEFKYDAAEPVWREDGSIWFNSLCEGVQAVFCAQMNNAVASNPVRLTNAASPVASWRITRYTDESLWYDFDTPFGFIGNENGEKMLVTRCSMLKPVEIVAVALEPDAKDCDILTHENDHLLADLKEPKMEARHMKTVDGKDMLTWVLYPPEFDETKVYPAIEITLGGPQESNSQHWSYRWCYRLMAEEGYIVALPNRRGTTGFGQEWKEQISGDYIGLNMQDYLVTAKEMKAEPYVGKLAACGASYGGYSVYYLAGMHEGIFDCFIAHAGIFNEEQMYYTTEEMWFPNWDNGGTPDEYEYMPNNDGSEPIGPAGDGRTFGGMKQSGSPWSNAPKAVRHYSNSPHTLVANWNTPILMIHGMRDFRIPYEQGMAAFNAARMMGVPAKLLVFPTETHWILAPQNALFWQREYFEWLDRWCK